MLHTSTRLPPPAAEGGTGAGERPARAAARAALSALAAARDLGGTGSEKAKNEMTKRRNGWYQSRERFVKSGRAADLPRSSNRPVRLAGPGPPVEAHVDCLCSVGAPTGCGCRRLTTESMGAGVAAPPGAGGAGCEGVLHASSRLPPPAAGGGTGAGERPARAAARAALSALAAARDLGGIGSVSKSEMEKNDAETAGTSHESSS